MQDGKPSSSTSPSTRRQFLKTSSLLAVASGAVVSPLGRVAAVHAAGDDLLKVGLIGCGGRGTGAAINALMADPRVQLTAMADAFEDRLQSSLEALENNEDVAEKIDVPKERQFVGFDAYKQLLATGVDVVLLTSPPHFRPSHLQASVDAGAHIFCEKPVAVDAPGVRRVLETCKQADEKGLSIVSGLCLRYHPGFQEAIRRIHDGEIGDVNAIFVDDYRGSIWVKQRKPDWTDMHWQMRNWYYFTWLSGDFNVEQHVHYLDVAAWTKGSYPNKAIGMGGRQVRTEKKYGNIYDHHGVTYLYKDGTRIVSNCRQQENCANTTKCMVHGSQSRARIYEGQTMFYTTPKWRYQAKPDEKSIYQIEHDRLFESIRSGKPINNGQYMADSTLMAIMGRMATYTGQEISWEQALHSKEDLTPAAYAWGPAPEVIIAKPGVTKFV